MVKGMKQTEIGLIPEDWVVGTFEDCLTGFSSGMTPYRAIKEYYQGDFPWITSGELNYNIISDTLEKISLEAIKKTNLKIIPKGTFLMAITGLEAAGTRGSCAITGIDATTNQSCMALYPIDNKITTTYLFHYYVRYGNELAFKYCQGTKQQSYNAVTAKKLPIFYPISLVEQEAIAGALSDADAWIESLEQLIAKKRLIKQGAMQDLLTPKENWELKKLGDLVKLAKSGGTPLSSIKDYYNGEIPFLSISNMTAQGKYLRYTSNKISQAGIDNSASWLVPKDSIIYSMYASVGLVSINKIKLATSQAVLNLIIKDEYFLEFIYYYLVGLQSSIMKFVGEGTQKNLNAQTVKDFDIAFPSLTEQTRIATILSDMDAELEALEQQLHKARQIKQGMMQELLTGKIRFEL